MANWSSRQMLRITIALACLLGLGGGITLAAFLRDPNIFYTAASSVVAALFFSWAFDVWAPDEQSVEAKTGVDGKGKLDEAKRLAEIAAAVDEQLRTKSEEIARKVSEMLTTRFPAASAMTVSDYQVLQNKLIQIIHTCLTGEDEEGKPGAFRPA
jgi:hypothetical protein